MRLDELAVVRLAPLLLRHALALLALVRVARVGAVAAAAAAAAAAAPPVAALAVLGLANGARHLAGVRLALVACHVHDVRPVLTSVVLLRWDADPPSPPPGDRQDLAHCAVNVAALGSARRVEEAVAPLHHLEGAAELRLLHQLVPLAEPLARQQGPEGPALRLLRRLDGARDRVVLGAAGRSRRRGRREEARHGTHRLMAA